MNAEPRSTSFTELKPLLPYLRRYRGRIAVGLLMVIVANVFSLMVPRLLGAGIDALAVPGATASVVTRYALLAVGVAIIGGIGRYLQREFLNGVSRRVEFDLRNDFFRHLLRLDASFYARVRTGDLMSLATNDIPAVRMVAGPAYMYLVNTAVVSVLILALMTSIDARLTMMSLIPMIALPPITIYFGRVIHERFEKIQAQFGVVSTMVQESLSGVRIVKAYRQEEAQQQRFHELSDDYLERNLSLVRVSGLFHPLLALFSGLAMVIALLFGARSVMAGQITVGELVEFILYLGMFTWPLIALGWVINLFQRGAASMARLNRVFIVEPEVHEAEVLDVSSAAAGDVEVEGEIEFKDVWFKYPGADRWALEDISFTIPAGSQTAIVGTTGSGKSTIVALLARLYDPDRGQILLDGEPLERIPLDTLRRSLGVVPQDTFLFSDSIRSNLEIGFTEEDEAARDRRIREAAAIAQLDETIGEFPDGYETMLGERGINLSGGQKQRAALARAIARDPEILILDDALSAVDTHTEAEILSGLRGVLRKRTSVVVSHRVSAVMNADQILVFQDGRLVETGLHEELLREGGLYATLQRRQLLADDLESGTLARSSSHI